jgi:hypothetical protein
MRHEAADGDVVFLARPGRRALVAATLDELQGPVSGVVELPLGLMWLQERSFDLDDREQRLWMYAIVLREARGLGHLRRLLNGGLLAEVWSELSLPRGVRRAWESQHPQLSAAAAA